MSCLPHALDCQPSRTAPHMTPSLQQHTPSANIIDNIFTIFIVSRVTSVLICKCFTTITTWHFHSFKLSLSLSTSKCVNISLLLLPTSCRLQKRQHFLISYLSEPIWPASFAHTLSETSINSSLFCIMASSWRNLIFRHSACFTHGWPMDPNTHNSFFFFSHSVCRLHSNLSCLPIDLHIVNIYYLIKRHY